MRYFCYVLLLFLFSYPSFAKSQTKIPGVKKIQDRSGEFERDNLILENGDKLEGFGFVTKYVGALPFSGPPSVLLFRTQSCMECEPTPQLTFYSLKSKNKGNMEYAVRTTAEEPDEKFSEETVNIRVIYGKCFGDKWGVYSLIKTRAPKIVNKKWQVGDKWDVVFTKHEFSQAGEDKSSTEKGKAPDFDKALNKECVEIAGETSYYYI